MKNFNKKVVSKGMIKQDINQIYVFITKWSAMSILIALLYIVVKRLSPSF